MDSSAPATPVGCRSPWLIATTTRTSAPAIASTPTPRISMPMSALHLDDAAHPEPADHHEDRPGDEQDHADGRTEQRFEIVGPQDREGAHDEDRHGDEQVRRQP